MALVCKEIPEWIEEEVEKPIEKWVTKTEKKCKKKKCKWWCLCCNKWFCWLVTIVVKVVTWVVVTVGKWVTRTVCKNVTLWIDFVVDVITSIYDIIVGIFTWDWARVWDGFVGLVTGTIGFLCGIGRIVFLGDTIDFIREEINTARLRRYVAKLLERKYKGDQLEAIKDALGVDYGVFGFRITAKAIRTYVESHYKRDTNGPPDLILWHEDPNLRINIKELTGFDYSEFFRRFRPEVVTGSGSVSEGDIDDYITTRGVKGKSFTVYAMNTSVLDTKLNTASEKGRQLGLIFKWLTEDKQVIKPEHVRHAGFDTNHAGQSLIDFLVEVAGRHRKSLDPKAAQQELCTIPAVGVFWYTDKLNGLTVNYVGSDASGLTFKDRIPDFVWKYVPIHEIGHYFGLEHVSGLDRIMYSPAEDDETWLSWWLLPEYLYLEGGPGFTFEEAKKAWDYIVEHFTPSCLSTRA